MLTQIKCQSCGSNIRHDDNKKNYVCEYCGAEFIVEDTVNNFQTVNQYHTTQNITKHIYGKDTMDANDFIHNADVFVSLGEFHKAETLYNKAIDANPADWRGWFGIVKVRTLNFSKTNDKTHLEFLSKAKKVATEDQKIEIENLYREFLINAEKEKQQKEALDREEDIIRQRVLKKKETEMIQKEKKSWLKTTIIVGTCTVVLLICAIYSFTTRTPSDTGTNSSWIIYSLLLTIPSIIASIIASAYFIHGYKTKSDDFWIKRAKKHR